MLITRFNKLIRSRILWSSIAVVIAFFFVGSSVMSRGGCGAPPPQRGDEGRLFGENIPRDVFHEARFFEMGFQPLRNASPQAYAMLRRSTFVRLASLELAGRMGIVINDDEVRDTIANDPTFQVDGTFSPAAYQVFLQRTLRADAATFERYVRQELVLSKLRTLLQASVWISPYELMPRLDRLTDSVAVSYVSIPREGITNAVPDITEEEARAFFEDHREQFAIPDRLTVRYATFPVTNYLAAAQAEVSTNDVRDYYEINERDYLVTDTNGLEQLMPFPDVRDTIRRILEAREARLLARDAATDFSMALTRDSYGKASTLEDAAAAAGVLLRTSEPFAADEPIPGLDAGPALTRAAFELVPNDPDRYFSDAEMGESNAYVIAAHTQEPAREATFEEVRDEVVAAAQAAARDRAFEARVEDVRAALAAALEDTNTTFAAAADQAGYAVSTSGVFTVYQGMPEEDGAPGAAILPAILDVDPGTLTEPVDTPDGVVIATVTQRTPGDPTAIEMLRPELRQSLERFELAAVAEGWGDYLLALADFEDYRASPDDVLP